MAKLEDFVITINGAALSDLFFNSALDNYHGLGLDFTEPVSDDQLREAVLKDAVEFSVCVGQGYSTNPSFHQALVTDFLDRL